MNEKLASYGVLLLIFALVVRFPSTISSATLGVAGGLSSILGGISTGPVAR
jgi:hypothetical protein